MKKFFLRAAPAAFAIAFAPFLVEAQHVTGGQTAAAGSTQDFSGATHTRPAIVVANVGSLPATCTVGEQAFVTAATAGQQGYKCSATNTWTQDSGSGGGSGITQLTGDVTAGPGSGSQAATLTPYTAPGTGAVAITQAAQNAVALNVKNFGAVGDGSTDDTTAIAAAHAAVCAAGGGDLLYPAGTYIVTPVSGGSASTFQICSGMHMILAGGATVRVKANAGDYYSLYSGGSSEVTNFTLDGAGTIDQNPVNNSTSSISVASATTTAEIALAIFGTDSSNLHIRGVNFIASGINTVDVNGAGISGVYIEHCAFTFGVRSGQSYFDNSTIYTSATNVHVEQNTFGTLNSAIADLAGTAIEVHNGAVTVTGNTISWFTSGGNIVNTNQSLISGNSIYSAGYGFSLWALASSSTDGNTFSGNTIFLDQLDRALPSVWGIALYDDSSVTGNHSNLTISGNTIEHQQETSSRTVTASLSYGIGLQAEGTVTNVLIQGNTIVNAPIRGISVGIYDNTKQITNVLVTGNPIVDAGTNPYGASSYNAAIVIQGNAADVKVFRNPLRFTTNPLKGSPYTLQDAAYTFTNVYAAENPMVAVNGTPANGLDSNVGQYLPYSLSASGSVSSGVGSGATGVLALTGKTSAATSQITVDDSNTATIAKLPNDSTSGLYVATSTSATPSAGCAEYTGTGTQTNSTGSACGGSSFPLTFVQEGAYVASSSATSFTVTFPQTTAASGNTVFMLVAIDGSQTITFPSGWTVDLNVTEASYARFVLLHKATASDTSAMFSASSTGIDPAVYFFEVAGSHALDQSSTGGVANSPNVTLPTITPTANSIVFSMLCALQDNTTSVIPIANPVNPNWRVISVAGTLTGSRTLSGFISTIPAIHVATTPPQASYQGSGFLSSAGIAYATFSIL